MSNRREPGAKPTVKSILSKTTKRGECRLWIGAASGEGYPYVYSGKKATGMRSVRSVVWALSNGPMPAGCQRLVMTCMNKQCVAREHIKPMSWAESGAHAALHGSYKTLRHLVAATALARKDAIINDEKAAQVRHRVLVGKEDRKTVAASFGVTRGYIDYIVRGARVKPPQMARNASVFHQMP